MLVVHDEELGHTTIACNYPITTLCKKVSNHHANLPLEMYSFTL